MATVANLLSSARYQLHDTDQNKWTGAELLDYVNRAYRVLNTRLVQLRSDLAKTSTTQVLTPSTENYSLPSDFQALDFMQIDDEDTPLKQVDMSYIETYNYVFTPANNATPTCFALFGGEYYLRPIPDEADTLNIYYYAQLSDLDSGDTTPYGGIADEAIIAFIVEMALARDEHNTGRQQNALSGLLRLADILFKRRDKTLHRINAYRWEYQGLV